ncbi:MAG TPA: hypothetical protein VGF84_23340 [Micromonosporaceae bacterium]|jgi:hypothetical protein
MDLLDRVLTPGTDLLERVDDLLTGCGAPDDHPIWRAMSRVGVLPLTALAQVATLDPDGMRSLSARLAEIAAGVRTVGDPVPRHLESRGLVADGFTAGWQGLAAQIATGPDGTSLAERIAATGAHLDDAAEWAAATRRDLAGEVGACLGSIDAVLVRTSADGPDDHAIRAAADIGARVLESVSRSVGDGWQRFGRWSGIDTETPTAPTAGADSPHVGHIELR